MAHAQARLNLWVVFGGHHRCHGPRVIDKKVLRKKGRRCEEAQRIATHRLVEERGMGTGGREGIERTQPTMQVCGGAS
jgi:hypothetical protein